MSVHPSRLLEPGFAYEIATRYKKLLRQIAAGADRVTDKMPLNYTILGALNMLFPKARIVHCRRHPIDTCLSILMNTLQLKSPPNYALDLEDLAFCYRQYARLMSHWRQVLPASVFLEVDYEELVLDRETVTSRMVEFCGVEWDDACLHHEQNTRAVDTPSKWQVRQPIYSTSIGRWKNYEPWLGPILELGS